MKRVIYIILLFNSFSIAQTNLKLNEIMFYPLSGNNEFIELYNPNLSESIELNGYKIKYYTSSADVITDAGEGTVLPPASYAVIFEGDYDFSSGIYNNLIPTEALILKISDNSFGSTGMSNTSNRPIWLLSSSDDTIDVITYSANNMQSHSDEKIHYNTDSSQTNWVNSILPNGTPGFRNSVTPLGFDLCVSAINISPLILIQGEDISICAVLKNSGENTAENFNVKIYNDINLDSIPQNDEQILSQVYFNLTPGDSISTYSQLLSASAGNYNIIVKVIFASDEDTSNNIAYRNFIVYPQGNLFNDVVINEIMYAPVSDEPEWIEIYNRTATDINLNNWKFSDNSHTVNIANDDIYIPHDSFIVLTRDSSILNYYTVPSEILKLNLPALNNTGDAVVIKDSLGIIMDSLFYLPHWGGNSGGRSLERISVDEPGIQQDNWKTSEGIIKATPGKINSVTVKNNDMKICGFNPTDGYGIIGEQIKFEININNAGLSLSPNFFVSLYDDVNQDSIPQSSELVSSLNSVSLSPGDSITLFLSSGNCREGENYFIAKLFATPDEDTSNNIAFTSVTGIEVFEERNDLIINEFMYDPDTPQPEWVEIYNRSNKIIDVKNYRIADEIDSVKVNKNSLLIYPGTYLIISDDSSIINYFNISSVLIVKSFPTLNNSGDKIILLDSLNRVIDSLEYSNTWGGNNSKSLERLNSENSSTDPSNWRTSISRLNATPGYLNSVVVKDYDISVEEIISYPLFPVFGDNVILKIKLKNLGKESANYSILLYEDTNLDSLPDILLKTIPNLNLQPGDSSTIESGYNINNIRQLHNYLAHAVFNPDMDTSNNYIFKNIIPGYPPLTLVINEIMYSPFGGEPEWVEIYNTASDSINLYGWKISDILTTPSSTEIHSDVSIPPLSYLVMVKDSSVLNYHRFIPSQIVKMTMPVLNNDADGFNLKDPRGQLMDSVFFSSEWGGTNGYSLERISSSAASNILSNWGSSDDIELSTPGRINSITPKTRDLKISKISSQPEFPVEGDSVFIAAVIRNKGSQIASEVSVGFWIDTDSDKVVDKLLSQQPGISLAPDDSIYLISTQSLGDLASGLLTAVKVISPNDEDTLNNYAERIVQYGFAGNSIDINEIMYNPIDGEPEWIELVNISNDSINLKDWSVSDLLSTPSRDFITGSNFYLQPASFAIIARDTSFFYYHPGIQNVFISNFGTLGNLDDGVTLYDFRDALIDRVHYKSGWGGKDGRSLERISTSAFAENKNNWTTCLSPDRSTPGKENFILKISTHERNSLIVNEIMFDPGIDNCEFIEFYNRSTDSINVGGWKIEDAKANLYNLSDTSLIIDPGDYFLLSADSIIRKKYSLNDFQNITYSGTSNLGLSNADDLIFLKDLRGKVIDSISYSANWTNKNINITKNKSLERINPDMSSNYPLNWSTCVNPAGATPGKKNSIYATNDNKKSKISVSPNPFSPDDDGFEDFSIINFTLTQLTSQIRIKIFDNRGRLIRTLVNNQATASQGSVIFNGLDDEGMPLRMGIYIVFLEALNDNSGVVENLKTVIVIARKL